MDRTEAFAEEFLKRLGHRDLIYEPDGNVPPDFLAADGTAVEVRRLNQIHIDQHGNTQGLETADVALWRTMGTLLDDYETSQAVTNTFGVFYEFGRPIPPKRKIERELRAELDHFLSGDRQTTMWRKLPCGLRLRFFDWTMWKGTPFRLAGNLDRQRGGWIVQKLEAAIRQALFEKESKILGRRQNYPTWWLVLIDHVSWGTDENDRRQLRDTGPFVHSFDRVFVVNAQSVDDYFEL